eukprot:CAMPEP_0113551126 /NCGR_PEP_ID=MMETSP0015_2-20120614/14358_1 /TAXON_ID=2838 /ORGANISM="Odontella" /LENGTH=262 /DNA_ID=CAMNT_0000451997 /DNA_START=451 /DNA_END=1238 /DNA_ORIENTATION=+ /assembly_acc=CAM_ASM_000160
MADRCSICLEELHCDIGVAVPCGHCFHRRCFDSLRSDCASQLEEDDDSTRDKVMPHCPCCKKRTKHFYNVFLTFDQGKENGCNAGCADATKAVVALTGENVNLTKRLREMKSLSRDQSELLFRILPQYDEMESKYKKERKESAHLKEKNLELEKEKEEIHAKKRQIERRLKETDEENLDLHFIWDELDSKLLRTRKKRKEIKCALKEQAQELSETKKRVNAVARENKRLKLSLEMVVAAEAKRDSKASEKDEEAEEEMQQGD